jgi:hypothetical protein
VVMVVMLVILSDQWSRTVRAVSPVGRDPCRAERGPGTVVMRS